MYAEERLAMQSEDEEMSGQVRSKISSQTHSMIHNYSHNTNNTVLSHQSTTLMKC